jgi:hypothetical protein
MLEYLKQCWKQVAGAVGVLAIITGIITLEARYAKTAEIEKISSKIETTATAQDNKFNSKITKVESDVSNTIKEVTKSLQLQQDVFRLNFVSDQMMKTKSMMKTYPKDQELKEDYENLKLERAKIQMRIDKGIK